MSVSGRTSAAVARPERTGDALGLLLEQVVYELRQASLPDGSPLMRPGSDVVVDVETHGALVAADRETPPVEEFERSTGLALVRTEAVRACSGEMVLDNPVCRMVTPYDRTSLVSFRTVVHDGAVVTLVIDVAGNRRSTWAFGPREVGDEYLATFHVVLSFTESEGAWTLVEGPIYYSHDDR